MFSKKEIEIIKLRKQNLKQTEVAEKLEISQAAVSSFEKRIKEKIIDANDVINKINEFNLDF